MITAAPKPVEVDTFFDTARKVHIQPQHDRSLTTDAILHRNGFDSPIEDSAAPIHDHAYRGRRRGGVPRWSETRALALKMAHLAHHDTLTGLPNRTLLQSRMDFCSGLSLPDVASAPPCCSWTSITSSRAEKVRDALSRPFTLEDTQAIRN